MTTDFVSGVELSYSIFLYVTAQLFCDVYVAPVLLHEGGESYVSKRILNQCSFFFFFA